MFGSRLTEFFRYSYFSSVYMYSVRNIPARCVHIEYTSYTPTTYTYMFKK